ncbi:hypothetical protein TUMEXPCC7403_20185 [Tumidithrix helvetica PCC 7403]|uniref:hypothetical protein n=1 Tax=Tumidithrix helvetica TaxID=3457545 RepID=UPI003CB95278
MKKQWMAMIASGLIGTTLFAIPPAQADTNSLTKMFPVLVGIQLTPAQQAQLEGLSDRAMPQILNLLSSEQQAQFKAALAEGNGIGRAMMSLNLSMSQKLKLRNIAQSLRSQLTTILTDEQQQQLTQNLRSQLQGNH